MIDENEPAASSLLTQLLESVDIALLVAYQARLVDELEDHRTKIEEYASKDLAEGLLGGSGLSTDEMRMRRENAKNKQAEIGGKKKKAEEDLKIVKKTRKDKFDAFFKDV